MLQKKFIAPVAVFAVCVVGYFALSAYTNKQAQRRINELVDNNGLAGKVQWGSLSTSLFGGSVSLKDVEFGDPGSKQMLVARQVTLSKLIDSDKHSRGQVEIVGLSMPPSALSTVSGMGRMVGLGGFGEFGLLLASGKRELQPFDVTLFADIDDDDATFKAKISVDMPELFNAIGEVELNNVNGVSTALRNFQALRNNAVNSQYAALGLLGLGSSLPQTMAAAASTAELKTVDLSYRDNGFVARSVILQKRYNTPLDPEAGKVTKQQDAYFEQTTKKIQTDCEHTASALAPGLSDGCELFVDLLNGKNKGLHLTIDPKDKVRVIDLQQTGNGPASKHLWDKLNPRVRSL